MLLSAFTNPGGCAYDDGLIAGEATRIHDEAEFLWTRRFSLTDLPERVAALPRSGIRDLFESHLSSCAGDVAHALGKAAASCAALVQPNVWRARVLRRKAALLADLGLFDEAVTISNQALEVAKAIGDRVSIAGVLQDRATFSFNCESMVAQKLREAMEIADTTDADDLRALIRYNIAYSTGDRATFEEKVRALEEAEPLAEHSWPDLHLRIKARQAELALDAGDLDRARLLASRLPRPEDVRNLRFACGIAVTLAKVDIATGSPERAVALLEHCTARSIDEDRVEMLPVLADAYEALGNYREALRVSRAERDLLLRRTDARAQSSSRALEIWFHTEQTTVDAKRHLARAQELESALAQLRDANSRIQEISTHDALTGLHNRQHLIDAAPSMLGGQTVGNLLPAQIAVLDVDGFKRLNDTFGHKFGDAVLVRVAQLLRNRTLPNDLIVRHGGDEFVIIRRPGEQRDLADDMRALVADFRRQSWRESDQVAPGQVTVSVGIAAAPSDDVDAAIHAADLLMYEAKRAGGNRIACARRQVERRQADRRNGHRWPGHEPGMNGFVERRMPPPALGSTPAPPPRGGSRFACR